MKCISKIHFLFSRTQKFRISWHMYNWIKDGAHVCTAHVQSGRKVNIPILTHICNCMPCATVHSTPCDTVHSTDVPRYTAHVMCHGTQHTSCDTVHSTPCDKVHSTDYVPRYTAHVMCHGTQHTSCDTVHSTWHVNTGSHGVTQG
jgi:hypothetical protein